MIPLNWTMTVGRWFAAPACWYVRTFPRSPGRWRFTKPLRSWIKTLYPEAGHDRIVQLSSGAKLRVDAGDFLGRHVYVCGEYEESTTSVVKSLVRPGDCVLDVGANIGYFTVCMAVWVGPTGSVHAFEAAPRIHSRLQSNIDLNGLRNVTIHAVALSDHEGTVPFFEATHDHLGISSLRQLDSSEARRIEVRCTTLDSLLPAGTRVRLAKIDVEGAEMLVLEGMRGVLERDSPYIVLELTDEFLRKVRGSAAEVIAFLRDRNYALYRIEWDCLVPLEETAPKQCNVLCVPAGQPVATALPVRRS
jgi:FkbM family methyltransferase